MVKQDWSESEHVDIYYFTNKLSQCSYQEYYERIVFSGKQTVEYFSSEGHKDKKKYKTKSVEELFNDLISLFKKAKEQVASLNTKRFDPDIRKYGGKILVFICVYIV